MRSTPKSSHPIAAIAAIGLSLAACQTHDTSTANPPASAAVVSNDTARTRTDSAGGDIASDSSSASLAPVAGRWLTDANVLSLVSAMSSRQIAAADAELQAWHADTVRAFAAAVARDHAELQHSVDSLSERIHLPPIAPALAEPIAATMQAQIDSMKQNRGGAFDRAFVREQVASEGMMADYLQRMIGVAERPEVQALLASAVRRVGADLARARTLDRALTVVDSVAVAAAADSAARRAARRKH